MENCFLLAGIAALMLSACNNKPAQELTLSGLEPVKHPSLHSKLPRWNHGGQGPSVILEPEQTYNSECVFKFSVEK